MAADGEATASTGFGAGLSHLPWQQIPKCTPNITNIDEYTRRLEFLRELWPAEHLGLLGPRAALQVEGTAFQRISRIEPEKLRSPEGIRLLVESLGGSWGRIAAESRFYFLEQTIYQVQQKADESNDSYIARHDTFFENSSRDP